jgi:hypothetical protein
VSIRHSPVIASNDSLIHAVFNLRDFFIVLHTVPSEKIEVVDLFSDELGG